jgi:topoisomerase-4 subunit A
LQLELGKSSLGALQLYWDEITGRIATDARGKFIGAFDTGDKLFVLYTDGTYEVADLDMQRKWMPNEIYHIGKFNPRQVISAVYYEGHKGWTLVKRFQVETTTENAKLYYLTDHSDTRLLFATVHPKPVVSYKFKIKSKTEEESIKLHEFIDVKGWKAQGNKLSEQKLTSVKGDQLVVVPKVSADAGSIDTADAAPAKSVPVKTAPAKAPTLFDEPTQEKAAKKQTPPSKGGKAAKTASGKNTSAAKTPSGKLKAGDSIEFNVPKKSAGKAAKKKKK